MWVDAPPELRGWQSARASQRPEDRAVVEALNCWAERFGLADEWIFDIALETLYCWTRQHEGDPNASLDGWRVQTLAAGYSLWVFAPDLHESLLRAGPGPMTKMKRLNGIVVSAYYAMPGAVWVPEVEDWTQFKKRIEREFRRQLNAYRAKVLAEWGSDPKVRTKWAKWMALFHTGRTVGYIARKFGDGVTPHAVMQAVREFSVFTGLTTRTGKAGRPRR